MNPGELQIVNHDGIVVNGQMRNRVRKLSFRPIDKKNVVDRADGTAVPWPLLYYSGGNDLRLPHTDGGHLMALSLGGPNVSPNVVSMYSGFNRYGRWKATEKTLKQLLRRHGDLIVDVEMNYAGEDNRIPSQFHVQAKFGTATVHDEILQHEVPLLDCCIISTADAKMIRDAAGSMGAWTWKGSGRRCTRARTR